MVVEELFWALAIDRLFWVYITSTYLSDTMSFIIHFLHIIWHELLVQINTPWFCVLNDTVLSSCKSCHKSMLRKSTRCIPIPSQKLSSPVENYTPILSPSIWLIEQILTAKYRVIFSIPAELSDLKRIEIRIPRHKNTWWYQSQLCFSPLFYPTG